MKRLLMASAVAVILGASQLGYALVALEIPLLYGSTPPQHVRFDVTIYYSYASRIVDGQIPYRDFTLEYPPLALPFFLLPRFFTSDQFRYETAFVLEMFAANALTIGLVAHRLSGLNVRGLTGRRLAWYTLTLFALCPMAALRYDLLVMAWMFAAAFTLSANRPAIGGILSGAGLLLKIVPGVVILPALAEKRTDQKRFRRRALAGFAAALALGMGLWLVMGGAKSAKMIMYHVNRGIEIESTYAGGLLIAAKALGAPIMVVSTERGPELQTPWSSTVGAIAFPLQAIAIGITLWRARRASRSDPLRYAGAAVLAFIVFGKVLTPQYLLWLIPFIACVNGRTGFHARCVFLAASVATTLIFPFTFKYLETVRTWAVLLLNLRNGLLLGLWVLLTFGPSAGADRK